ncbi:MAG: hypothetical protein CMP21_07250 [Rickettsiales bacterium]|nr:hypothetical protein [Rickettsiales bacterium]
MLDTIVKTIRDKNTRWDGLVQLKELEESDEIERFSHYCEDSFWLIRWAVIEKIGDLKIIECLDILFEKLADKDSHVRKNTQKAIIKCTKDNIKPIINNLESNNQHVILFCRTFLAKHLDKYHEIIQESLFLNSWIIANQLLHIIFLEKKEKAEGILINATKIKNTEKHAIMMLALINSKKGITHFISLFSEKPALKRHIIQAILIMDPSIVYPILIDYVNQPKVKKTVQEIIIKCGKPSTPYIIQSLHKKPFTEELIYCLNKTTITVPVYTLLEKKVSKYPILAKKINLINLKPK